MKVNQKSRFEGQCNGSEDRIGKSVVLINIDRVSSKKKAPCKSLTNKTFYLGLELVKAECSEFWCLQVGFLTQRLQ